MIIDTDNIPAELAGSTIKALCHLHEAGECRPTDLAGVAGITTAAVTGMIDRAEAAGLLMRVPTIGDRRSYAVQLTWRGRELVRAMGAFEYSIHEPLNS